MRVNRRMLLIHLACLCMVMASCSDMSRSLSDSQAWGIASTLAGEPAFYVPVDPPSASYTIEATCSVNGSDVPLEGHMAVNLRNTTKRPISVIALKWTRNPKNALDVSVGGTRLEKHPEQPSNTLIRFFSLPEALKPNQTTTLDIDFNITLQVQSNGDILRNFWHPQLWWDGLPTRDSYRVKLDPPTPEYKAAYSGRFNPSTNYYENPGITTNFGFLFSKSAFIEERDADGVQVRTLFKEDGRECAMLCLETAVDVIKFYKEYHGSFPFESLTIIPGGSRPMGGYPFASALVVIHGQQAFDQRPLLHWKWITAHEIGHQYWGEYIMSGDEGSDYTESWLMIGMGIFADRAYTEYRGLSDDKHVGFFNRYKSGINEYLDTTADAPESLKAQQNYDRNNVLIHGKGYSIVSALRHTLGGERFKRLYLRAIREYGGKRMGYRDLRRMAEEECGENLGWFFESWVRSPRYLCYEITAQESKQKNDGFVSVIKVERKGGRDSFSMPIDVQATFEDGSTQTAWISRFKDKMDLRFESAAKLEDAVLDPRDLLARLDKPRPVLPEELPARIRNLPYNNAWDEGLELYKMAVKHDVQIHRIWFKLGMVIFEGGYLEEALTCFNRVHEMETPVDYDFMALTWMGNVWDARGNREEAVKFYRLAKATGSKIAMRHDQFGIQSSPEWIESRLKEPYDWSTVIKKKR